MDEAANIATIDGKGRMRPSNGGQKKKEKLKDVKMPVSKKDWKKIWSEVTDAVMDVPLGGVCEVLYVEGLDHDTDEGEP